ncbi:MAG: hypothetical protein KUG65_02210 [Sphingomonadaceae bacterium]|nr:hypothetical protein [Sphingomonadaceae bacterium]
MAVTIDLTAWSATLGGVYLLFTGIGALRNPEAWRTLIKEVGASPALQILCGLLELLVGALILLANPWVPSDILSCVLRAAGGLMMIEALMITGFSDIYTQFLLRTFGHLYRGLSIMMIVVGLALLVLGQLRFA